MSKLSPKEKAKELCESFDGLAYMDWMGGENELTNKEAIKECAFVTIDEILKVYELLDEDADLMFKEELKYWHEVKQEIEKS
jgi:hypothetical protein